MIYSINQIIVFDSEDRTLAWQERENEAVSLSIPVSRLLETLILNPGILLSRELLMREALEKHSLSPSINNLNNYVSLLRKALREFDLDGAIVTVPKAGLIFDITDVNVIENNKEDQIITDLPLLSEHVDSTTMVSASPVHHEGGTRQFFRWAINILSIVGLFLIGIRMIPAKDDYFPARSTMAMDGAGKCEIYYLYDRLTDEDDILSADSIDSLCSNNMLFFLSKKIFTSDSLDKRHEIIITCKRDGRECVTYVNY